MILFYGYPCNHAETNKLKEANGLFEVDWPILKFLVAEKIDDDEMVSIVWLIKMPTDSLKTVSKYSLRQI